MRLFPKLSIDGRVSALIGVVSAGSGGAIVASLGTITHTMSVEPRRVASMLALTLVLQLFSVPVYGQGGMAVSAVGMLATGFLLNTGTAMAVALITALVHWGHRRREFDKAVFDAGNFVLAAGAAGGTFHALDGAPRLLAAAVAGVVYATLNIGLVCVAMSLAEGIALRALWRERFHWARYYFLLFGPLALVAESAYKLMGLQGLFAFTLPPALMLLAFRNYLERTEAAVEEVRQANVRMRRAHRDTIAALSRSMEAKDLYTGGHTGRVAAVALALAERLGYDDEQLAAIEIGALLHDIGKIGIPEEILHKQGPLNDDEWTVMRTHPLVSDFILAELDLDPIVRQCARSSHERMDGCGYPDGLRGEDIPLPARIVFVADAFDAITSDRPYRRARSTAAALAEIEASAGTQFCPSVVAALHELWQATPDVLETEEPSPSAMAAVRALTFA
ncbi:MAG TPA: HD-GYP domain-containing protein [Gaiellaceae bacterium]|jgi:putative nucleotidyltransferase with HDIG domain|nr:HD-GYP domain-containing protein [Gaiellaceae bacterium]